MKKRWILSSILMAILGAGVLYLFFVPEFFEDDKYIKPGRFNLESFKRSLHPPELCYVKDEIGYYYYEEKDPDWEKNNKFGLYIYAEESDFLEFAQKMVNSKGGEWGYVLIPYNMDDRDMKKWNRVFGQLNEKKLIPIIQLWKLDVDNYKEQTMEVARFLNNFIWPIKYRYISVYNEPNDSRFWFGRVAPDEYAKILDYTIDEFKKESTDYFMLNGAFNVSASNNSISMDSFEYIRKMDEEIPGIFDKLDGWASHPYPQPNFSGNPLDKGRWSIRAYEDELKFLKEELDIKKDLLVFITETGWAHAEGEKYEGLYHDAKTISEYFRIAFEEVWLKDERVRAVTPFTIRYNPPYDHFSWINRDKVPYIQYEVVKSMKKEKGEPPALVPDSITFSDCE